jgi:O-antigen/teichoic acid export membrane protein
VALAWNPAIFGADLARYHLYIQIALLGIPTVMLNVLFVNTLAAGQRPAAAAGLNLVVACGLAVAALIGVKVHGLAGLYIATGIFGFSALLASIAYLRRTLRIHIAGRSVKLFDELRQSPQILSYSAYIYIAMSGYALTLLATRYVVLARLGEAPAGFLQASLSIALTVGAVLNPMSNLYLTPLVNRNMRAEEKAPAAHDFVSKMLALLLLASLPVVLFPRLMVALLYTNAFVVASTTLFLFVLWQCVYQVVNVYQQLLIGLDDVLFMALAATTGFGAAALLTYLLVPRLGLAGGALGLALGMLLYGAAALLRLRMGHAISIPAKVFVRTLVVITAVALAGWLFGNGTGELTVLGVLTRAVFGLGTVSVFWLLLNPGERDDILNASRLISARRATPTNVAAITPDS